jgi:hypothetical protein
MLQNAVSRATLSMSNASRNDPENPGYEPGAILAELRRLRSAEPASLGLAREIRADRESESLVALFDATGAVWTETAPQQSDELTGGEHLVYLDEAHGRVFKSTKQPRNVLTRPDGSIFSFDVVIIRPSSDLRWSLGLSAQPPPSP